jgi:ribose transport system ATP-binding protein
MEVTISNPSSLSIQPVLRLRGISKTFPGITALDRIDLTICPGEIHVLLGENGAGKSTLVKIIAGVFAPDPGGEIFLDEVPVDIQTPRQSKELGISVIHQELKLVPSLNAIANIMLGHEVTGRFRRMRHRTMRVMAIEALKKLDVELDDTKPVGQLSVAQQQSIEIAAALLRECRILILDEPTSALADHEVDKLGEILARLRGEGVAILYISHRFEEIFRFGDRVTVLRDGKLAGVRLLKETTREELVKMMVGREVAESFPERTHQIGEPLLVVEALSSPSGITDINLTVHRGEIVSLAGLMGSGRSEVARAIFGADSQATGKVTLGGRSVPMGAVSKAIKAGIALSPEDRKTEGLVMSMSVTHNITLSSLSNLASLIGRIDQQKERSLIRRFIDQLSIKIHTPRQIVATLSGGNQQKVVLAKWLNTGAELFMFDEPTRGIDVGTKQEIYALLNNLSARGAGILMISSELPEVLGMSDRIIVMCQGRVSGELKRSKATPDLVMHLATSQNPIK